MRRELSKKIPLIQKLRWRANYEGDTVLWEKDPKTGKENLFKDIDFNKMISFDLMKPIEEIEDVELGTTEIMCKSHLYDGQPAKLSMTVYYKQIQPFLHVDLPKGSGKRLIFVRKIRKVTGQDIAEVPHPKLPKDPIKIPFPPLARLHSQMILVGWQKTVKGENIQAINYVYSDGRMELGGDFKNDADHSQPALSDQARNQLQELADKGQLDKGEQERWLNTNKVEPSK